MQKNQISIVTLLIFFYILFSILFLKAQFQNSEMPKEISKRFLYNSSSSNSFPIQASQLSRKVLFLLIDSAKYSYWKQIKVLSELMTQYPKNCILAKTIVQQPTMTTQKIQTLMTGSEVFSITSIIDAFFSSSVSVDNIIHQVNSHNGTTVNIGDDTWNKLFKFTKSYPCSTTFDIWDWNTCDLIIYKNLEEEIKSENNLIVAHFLSLDHIGHSSSSITHPEFKQKKDQISHFIIKILNILPDDMILMITGDHGMRDDGNHGGASKQQSESFLFAYSKRDQLISLSSSNKKIQTKEMEKSDYIQQIKQPDITSTLSMLLAIPLPTNSIGIPIFIPAQLNEIYENINSQIFEICSNLMKHFVDLLNKNNVRCPQLMQGTVPTPLSLKQIQRNCLSHLSHKQPNIVLLGLIIFVMGLVAFIISVVIRLTILQYFIVLIISIPHSFSWFLIKNSTTYYLLGLLIVVLLMPVKKMQKTVLLVSIVILAQIEQVKNGEYSLNSFRIPLIANILASWEFETIVIISWMGVCIRKNIALLNNSKNNWVAFQLIIQVMLGISLILRSLEKEIELQTQINFILIVIIIISLPFSFYLLKYQQYRELLGTCLKQIILNFFVLFLGPKAISIYLTTKLIFSVLLSLQQDKNEQQASKSLYYYFCYLLSHLIWWIQGNRYEYSSIDIKQSYIFNTNYHQIINPICLIAYMIMPYLFTIFMGLFSNKTNRKSVVVLKEDQSERRNLRQLHAVEEGQLQNNDNNDANNVLANFNTKQKEEQHKSKYILIPFSWTVCCCINVIYNSQKILYTVVYIPMLVIQIAKLAILVIILMTIIQIDYFMMRRKNKNISN